MLRAQEPNVPRRDVIGSWYAKGVCDSRIVIHFHLMVPIFIFGTRDPANPLIDLFVSVNIPSKSSIRWDMHPEHQLLTPMFDESVSKFIIRAPFDLWVLACIDIISMQASHISLLMFWYTFLLRMYLVSLLGHRVVILMTLPICSLQP